MAAFSWVPSIDAVGQEQKTMTEELASIQEEQVACEEDVFDEEAESLVGVPMLWVRQWMTSRMTHYFCHDQRQIRQSGCQGNEMTKTVAV